MSSGAPVTGDGGFSAATVVGISAAVGLVPLNSTMIAVALPKIAEDFGISTGRSGILITLYLLAMLLVQPLAGRIGDVIGSDRLVKIALVGVAVTSLAAAASSTFLFLVVARLGQALFAAALGPSVQSLLRAITPPDQQGRTFGLMGSVVGVGAASGPVIGGILTQSFGWRSIFVFNVPIAAAALVVALRVSQFASPETVATVRPGPAERGRIANKVFVAAYSVQALSTVAQYALLLLTPIILHSRGWGSGATGAVLSALTVGMIVMSPSGGRLGDQYGRRTPTMVGLAVAAGAIVVFLIGGPSIATFALVLGLAAFGMGLGIATPSLTTAAIESVPAHRTGAAAGVVSTSRYVGSVTISIAISALVTADANGTRNVLWIVAASMAAALAATIALPGRVPDNLNH